MRAEQGVLDRLNNLLTAELTAINQYFLHGEMLRNWGYERLYHKIRDYSMEEMTDAQQLMQHILYLEGLPNLQRLGTVRVGESPREDLELDLQQEKDAVQAYREAIAHCANVGDFTTRSLLEDLLKDEEEQVDWLETQLMTIEQVGLETYLTQQITEQA